MEKATNPLIAAIEARARAHRLSLTRLALDSGLADTTLTKKKHDPGGISSRTIEKVARTLLCTPDDLYREAREISEAPSPGQIPTPQRRSLPRSVARTVRDLPVRGTASGAAANGFEILSAATEYVLRPPGLEGVDDAYAIYVASDSMIPKHAPGDLCFIHPHRMCRPGDSVIIQTRNYPGAKIESYIKRLVQDMPMELIAEQFNPPATLRYKKDIIVGVHKVMTMNDLFGV